MEQSRIIDTLEAYHCCRGGSTTSLPSTYHKLPYLALTLFAISTPIFLSPTSKMFSGKRHKYNTTLIYYIVIAIPIHSLEHHIIRALTVYQAGALQDILKIMLRRVMVLAPGWMIRLQRIYTFLLFHAIILSVLDVQWALLYTFVLFLGLTINRRPNPNCSFFAYFSVSQKRNTKRSPNRMKPSGT